MIGFKNIRDYWYCHIAPEKFAEKMYFAGIKLVSSQFVKNGDLVFDIGANIGLFSRIYLELGAREVIAVEPQEAAYGKLITKFYHDSRFHAYRAAVTDYIGKIEFHRQLNENSRFGIGAGSSLQKEAIILTKKTAEIKWITETVDAITLDYLINKHGLPDFCKIDTEGHEPQVISTLKEPIPSLSFELWPSIPGAMKSFDILATLGDYRFNYNLSGIYYSLALKNFLNLEDFKRQIKNLAFLLSSDMTIDVYAML